jgi:hypothetical protein
MGRWAGGGRINGGDLMARARGTIERRQKLADLPHILECPVPRSGRL